MLSKQDKITSGLSIKFGGGFRTHPGTVSNRYPPERLMRFLNVNPKNEADIIDFCNKYRFVPRDLRKGLITGFKKEHDEISQMAKKLVAGVAMEKDFAKIDRILNTRKTKTTYTLGKDLVKMIGVSGNEIVQPDDLKKKYLMQSTVHRGTIISLWEDLIAQIKSNQNLKTCANCGAFFILQSRHKRKYCDKPQCKNTYNKNRHRFLAKFRQERDQ